VKPLRPGELRRGTRWSYAGILALGAGLASGGALACREHGSEAAASPRELLRSDRRIAELLEPCVQGGFYDRELSDPVPFLIEKLERGRPEPQKRAKEELGILGERAIEALARFFESNYSDIMRSPFLENAVDAAAFNRTDGAHELLLRALQHPQESVRSKALDGLRAHARPADFDLLAERLRGYETAEMRRALGEALFAVDAARAEDLFLEWMERGEARDLWLQAGVHLPDSRREEVARRCERLLPNDDALLSIQLVASAARLGPGPALEALRADLVHADPQRRLAVVTAATRAGLADELERCLLEDESESVRAVAAGGIAAAGELTPVRRTWLRAALNDPSPVVRGEALKLLCERGDEEALARALEQLAGEAGPLQAALQALRGPMTRDAELARTAYERMLDRHARELHRPLQQRTATFKAVGLVPLLEAAAFLRRAGLEAVGERIESLRAHEWLMIQAANTGLPGRSFLREELAGETDPERRIDLIDAIGSVRDDLARETLLELVERPGAEPYEVLFAAGCAAKVGPSWEIAPRLKRVSYGLTGPEQAEARGALQCLLWLWY
jgi:hypothetical protein